jgi:hypothetical protein
MEGARVARKHDLAGASEQHGTAGRRQFANALLDAVADVVGV